MIDTRCTYIGPFRKVTLRWRNPRLESEGHLTVYGSTPLPSSTTNIAVCEQCGYDRLDLHRTSSALITYCQRCGSSTHETRSPPRRRWTEAERNAHREKQEKLAKLKGNGKSKKRR